MLVLLVARLGSLVPRNEADEISAATLKAGTTALMNWALVRRDDRRAPPGMLPYPDRHSDGNYDGLADCPPNLGVPNTNQNLLLGRLPLAGEPAGTPCEGEDFGAGRRAMLGFDAKDGNGDALWYVVSSNLVDDTRSRAYRGNVAGFQALTPAALRSNAAKVNWLTICGGDGTILTHEAAFVLISPGAPHPTQNRTAAAPPVSAYLDNITLPAGHPSCAGSKSHQINQRVFVSSPPATLFNDRIIYITADQFINQLALRAMASFRRALDDFAASHPDTGYPYPAGGIGQPCNPAIHSGLIPLVADAGCQSLVNWPSWDAPAEPGSWHANLQYQRVSSSEVSLRIAGCNDTFTLRRPPGSTASILERAKRRC